MIYRNTAMQWAVDSGLVQIGSDINTCEFRGNIEEVQSLVTRAMNEAYELAAQACNHYTSGEAEDMALQCQKHIRAMKDAK